MPVYREGRDRWRVVIYFRGKRRDWIVDGQKADAEAFEARKRIDLEAGRVEARVVPRLLDFLTKQYVPHAAKRLKARTLSNRQYQLATIGERLGSLKLTEITDAEILDYQNTRLDSGIAASTINDDVKVLRAVLSLARLRGIPCADLRSEDLPEGPRRNAHAWSREDLDRLYLATAEESPSILPLVVCLANTGLRKGEAIALRWENVDRAKKLLRIWPSKEWQPKSGEPREVPLADALDAWLWKRPGCDFVFPNRSRKPYAFWPQRAFDRARVAAGLAGGPHTLRHTYASHFLFNCPDLDLLARVLGHSHTYVTRLYAHLLPERLERARLAVSFPCPVTPEALRLSGKVQARSSGSKPEKGRVTG
jgi:integrase